MSLIHNHSLVKNVKLLYIMQWIKHIFNIELLEVDVDEKHQRTHAVINFFFWNTFASLIVIEATFEVNVETCILLAEEIIALQEKVFIVDT